MKFLVFIFLLMGSLTVQAGLISTQNDQSQYNSGDTIIVDISVNNINPQIDFLQLEYTFDNTQLEFVDNSWLDSSELFNYGAFGDAYLITPDTLIIQAFFLDGITTIVGNSFSLGQVEFTALVDSLTPNLALTEILAQDIQFGTITQNNLQVNASEPALAALFMFFIGAIMLRTKSNN